MEAHGDGPTAGRVPCNLRMVSSEAESAIAGTILMDLVANKRKRIYEDKSRASKRVMRRGRLERSL